MCRYQASLPPSSLQWAEQSWLCTRASCSSPTPAPSVDSPAHAWGGLCTRCRTMLLNGIEVAFAIPDPDWSWHRGPLNCHRHFCFHLQTILQVILCQICFLEKKPQHSNPGQRQDWTRRLKRWRRKRQGRQRKMNLLLLSPRKKLEWNWKLSKSLSKKVLICTKYQLN